MGFPSEGSARHCAKLYWMLWLLLITLDTVYKQSYFKSTPGERPRVNPRVSFISEGIYESCRCRQGRSSVKVSSLFHLSRQSFAVLFRKKGKGTDCWVNRLFLFYTGVCKLFNRDAYTEPPVVRGKEWVSFHKCRCISHTHTVRNHAYLDNYRRCGPCTQDEIKTSKNSFVATSNKPSPPKNVFTSPKTCLKGGLMHDI